MENQHNHQHPNESPKQYQAVLHTEPQAIEAGSPTKLLFDFKESDRKVSLDVSHEMKVHLMVVNEELNWFRHVHPTEQADGSYAISETFPYGGKYFLFADFKPKGAASMVDKKEIIVKGDSSANKADQSVKLISEVDGYRVTLENGSDLKTNRTEFLALSVTDKGRPLSESDIQPYLGATAHIAMISKEGTEFLHIHPMSAKRFPIYAETHIQKPGIYRVWVEFQTDDKVHTADFTVNVTEGEQKAADEGHHGHHH
ncbi:hypothetical protein [Olivibacter jilunii]|uniref:hypothetical protein n=1 Tax=Olivibacter jilunii TaxID=985016 RepID=UPI003F1439EB